MKTRAKSRSRGTVHAQKKGIWYEGYEARLEQVKRIIERACSRHGGPGWSYSAVAEWCGVSPSTVYNLMTGRVKLPSHHVIDRLCQGLGIKIRYED